MRLLLICKFLWINCLGQPVQSIDFFSAEQLYKQGKYQEAGLAYEKIVYLSDSKELTAHALLHKAWCKKSSQNFKGAIHELNRINTSALSEELFYLIKYETALCNYLVKDYFAAENNILEIFYNISDTILSNRSIFLYIMILNQQQKWDQARLVFKDYIREKGVSKQYTGLYNFLFKKKIFKNPKTAKILSYIIPGSGQIYAGKVFRGLTSMAFQAFTVVFMVNSYYSGYYFSGGITGIPILTNFYSGGAEYAALLVEKKNSDKAHQINQQLEDTILKIEKAQLLAWRLGVLIFNESDEKEKSKSKKARIWNFTNYNTDFKEVWTKDVAILDKLSFQGFDHNDKYLYLMFIEKDRKEANYQTLQVEVKSGSINSITGIIPNSMITEMCAMKDKLYIGGQTYPTKGQITKRMCLTYAGCCIPALFGSLRFRMDPILVHGDFKTKKTTFLPMNYEGQSTITNITYDDSLDVANAVLLNMPKKAPLQLNIKELSDKGKVLNTIKIDPKSDNVILSGKLATINSEEKILIGTYAKAPEKQGFSVTNAQSSNTSMLSMFNSQGIYFTKLIKGKQKVIKYYGFEKFKDFLLYVRKGTATRIKKKMKKKAAKNQEITISYQLLIHDIIVKDNSYILIAEAFYPEYHTEMIIETDSKGNTTTSYKQVFDGYRYTHAMAFCLDKNGDIQWNHSFKIQDILTFNLKERVQVLIDNDDIVLAYNYGGYIKSKVLRGSKILEGKKSTKIETMHSKEKVKKNIKSDISYWYDNYYIAYGFQKIVRKGESKKKGSARKRTVFYFNKVAFE